MGRRRRYQWAAAVVPLMAASLVKEGRREAAHVGGLADLAAARGLDEFAVKLRRNAAAAARDAAGVAGADLFWVTEPMARLAMDASQDIPVLTADSAPADDGLLVLEKPLPPWDTTVIGGLALRDGQRTDIPHTDPVDVDALQWALTPTDQGQELTVGLLCRPQRLPLPLLANQGPFLAPFATLTTGLPVSTRTVLSLGEAGASTDPEHVGVLSWLVTAWTFMATPSVATTSPANPPTGRRPATSRQTRNREVAIVDLRPARRTLLDPRSDHDTQTPRRRLTSRHVVRGHWTHQPHGPGHSLRRLQWIDDYIRGPSDAPLVTRTHVWAWRH